LIPRLFFEALGTVYEHPSVDTIKILDKKEVKLYLKLFDVFLTVYFICFKDELPNLIFKFGCGAKALSKIFP
jgi:hypothetical protein